MTYWNAINSSDAQWCFKYKRNARSIMPDTGGDGLRLDLTEPDTTECNDVSLRYWNWDKTDYSDVWLSTSVTNERNDRNGLVISLNKVIQPAVLDANNLVCRNVTHFVDLDSSFEGYCYHTSTAFFLSGWPDSLEGGTISITADASADLSTPEASDKLPLPDSNTCNTTLGVDPDPVTVYWCDLASTVSSDPEGDLSIQRLRAGT
ncbi:hypothetical protein F1880_007978 [Penicillium rolfsii]|nr:hypothetical protein F1880_007978 [Penicillium rolfsii]